MPVAFRMQEGILSCWHEKRSARNTVRIPERQIFFFSWSLHGDGPSGSSCLKSDILPERSNDDATNGRRIDAPIVATRPRLVVHHTNLEVLGVRIYELPVWTRLRVGFAECLPPSESEVSCSTVPKDEYCNCTRGPLNPLRSGVLLGRPGWYIQYQSRTGVSNDVPYSVWFCPILHLLSCLSVDSVLVTGQHTSLQYSLRVSKNKPRYAIPRRIRCLRVSWPSSRCYCLLCRAIGIRCWLPIGRFCLPCFYNSESPIAHLGSSHVVMKVDCREERWYRPSFLSSCQQCVQFASVIVDANQSWYSTM